MQRALVAMLHVVDGSIFRRSRDAAAAAAAARGGDDDGEDGDDAQDAVDQEDDAAAQVQACALDQLTMLFERPQISAALAHLQVPLSASIAAAAAPAAKSARAPSKTVAGVDPAVPCLFIPALVSRVLKDLQGPVLFDDDAVLRMASARLLETVVTSSAAGPSAAGSTATGPASQALSSPPMQSEEIKAVVNTSAPPSSTSSAVSSAVPVADTATAKPAAKPSGGGVNKNKQKRLRQKLKQQQQQQAASGGAVSSVGAGTGITPPVNPLQPLLIDILDTVSQASDNAVDDRQPVLLAPYFSCAAAVLHRLRSLADTSGPLSAVHTGRLSRAAALLRTTVKRAQRLEAQRQQQTAGAATGSAQAGSSGDTTTTSGTSDRELMRQELYRASDMLTAALTALSL